MVWVLLKESGIDYEGTRTEVLGVFTEKSKLDEWLKLAPPADANLGYCDWMSYEIEEEISLNPPPSAPATYSDTPDATAGARDRSGTKSPAVSSLSPRSPHPAG